VDVITSGHQEIRLAYSKPQIGTVILSLLVSLPEQITYCDIFVPVIMLWCVQVFVCNADKGGINTSVLKG
jgi:hypothetical protein